MNSPLFNPAHKPTSRSAAHDRSSGLRRPHLFLAAVLALGLAHPAPTEATLLVYEGYNYGAILSNDDSMDGVTTNATGLSGDYDLSGGEVNWSSNGLEFGSMWLPTSPGSVRIVDPDVTNTLDIGWNAGTQTGTVWNSYLFHFEAFTGGPSSNVGLMIQGDTTRFFTGVPTRNGGGGRFAPSTRYEGGVAQTGINDTPPYTGVGSTPDNVSFSTGVTYLGITKITRVGQALSESEPGVISHWVFTQANYEDWRTLGGGLESTLADYANWTSIQHLDDDDDPINDAGTFGLDNTMSFRLSGRMFGGTRDMDVTYDEIRWATSLDAVAIPEPAHIALGLGLLALGLTIWRRRRT